MADLPLTALRANEMYQPRERGLNRDHLERLRVSDPDTWPPLLVTPNDIGGYDVIDGFHRLHVARERGLEALRCEVEAVAGYPEAVIANLRHGLPLARRDRRQVARWLHAECPNLSLRQLGEFCGLDPKTVKRAIEEGEDFPHKRENHVQHMDPVDRLIRTLCSEPITTYFGTLPSLEHGADAVRTEIATYDDARRMAIAQYVAEVGEALTEGARHFLR